jgi:hypothetical protein
MLFVKKGQGSVILGKSNIKVFISIALVIAVSMTLSNRTDALGGSCSRAGASKIVKTVKYNCLKIGKKLTWVKVKTANQQKPSVTTTSVPISKLQLRTLSDATRNTSFQVALQEFPEIAQSITVNETIETNLLTTSVFGLNTVKPEFFSVPFNQKSKYEEAVFSFEPFDAKVLVTILKSISPTSKPILEESLDIASGFSVAYQERVDVKVHSNSQSSASAPMNLEFRLTRPVVMERGNYLIIFGFEWSRLDVLTLRLWGQESGSNTGGGRSGNLDKKCSYTPTVDAYPAGSAYMGLGVRKWDGNSTTSIGFGTQFRLATSKVTACIVKGEWGNDIFNPGDLDLALILSN